MKKIVLIYHLLLLSVMFISAQESNENHKHQIKKQKYKSPEERAQKNTIKAEKELLLTQEQKIKWESAALARIKANEPLSKKMKEATDPEVKKAIRQQKKLNNEKFDNTVIAFLSNDQKVKFEKMKMRKKQNRKAHQPKTKNKSVHSPNIHTK